MAKLPVENGDTLQRGQAILDLIGSFWLQLHSDKEMFRAYGQGLGEFMAQRYADISHTWRTLYRKHMPVHKLSYWRRVVILESSLEPLDRDRLKYADGASYGVDVDLVTVHTYGEYAVSPGAESAVEADWVYSSALVDCPIKATVMLAGGTDFYIEDGKLMFVSNPFNNTAMPIIPVYAEDGSVSDREISLWAFNSRDDVADMYNMFGIVLGSEAASSIEYNNLINAVFDSLVQGCTNLRFIDFVCACVGIKAVRNDEETVEEIGEHNGELVVITDKGAYVFPEGSSALVRAGDVVHKGDMLADTVKVLTSMSELSLLPGASLTHAFGKRLSSAVSFPNALCSTQYELVNGKVKLSCPLEGSDSAVASYWNSVHTAGVANGRTLAQALRTSGGNVGEPSKSEVPAYINPFELLIADLVGSLLVVKIKDGALSQKLSGIDLEKLLRKFAPARAQVILKIEKTPDIEYIKLGDSSSPSLYSN